MNITAKMLELDKKILLKGPKGAINKESIAEATKVVDQFSSDHSDELASFTFPSPLLMWETNLDGGADEDDWTSWMVQKGTYSGTWVKRYSSMCWKRFGFRPPEGLLAKVGEILSRTANQSDDYLVDFTNVCDWEPGEFGENENSCWWGEYNHAR